MSSSFDSAGMRKMADGLLKFFGMKATVTKRTEGAYAPSTGAAPIANASFTATVCMMEIRDRPGTAAELAAERRMLMSAAQTQRPAVGDTVKVGANKFQIVDVKDVAPAGASIIFDCGVRA